MSDLIKELRDLAASEEVADRAADELERLTKLNSQKNADISDWAEKYAEKCNEAAELREQLAEAQRQNESLQAAFLKVRVALGLDLHSNDNLLDAIAEAKRDAERYRWLRENCYDYEAAGDGDAFPHFALVFESDDLSYPTDTLDAAIDDAMEQTK